MVSMRVGRVKSLIVGEERSGKWRRQSAGPNPTLSHKVILEYTSV